MSELVSVLIGAYNAAPYLAEAIESAFAQTHRALEVVVVDDGSDDGTADVARAYRERIRFGRQERGGNGAARNRAVELARGDFFAFLDADDRLLPNRLELQLDAMRAEPAVDMVFGHVREFVSPELDAAARGQIREPWPVLPWKSANVMLIRRTSFERVGGFATDLRVGVTVDWMLRADEAGLRATVLPDVVLERRLHLGNNGLRERDAHGQYVHVVKAALDRRRATSS